MSDPNDFTEGADPDITPNPETDEGAETEVQESPDVETSETAESTETQEMPSQETEEFGPGVDRDTGANVGDTGTPELAQDDGDR